ncbi:hypothetical protein OIU74_012276 [Salix koriyanagi]|uniref:Uncharacterized protein n=1 Tax=Salix koriyanagi TaxID=2511006 RepID=A0A9Q0T542_9ROSI|nr:hypothetical protein OIU74_012276 [Salix koriyanagi]
MAFLPPKGTRFSTLGVQDLLPQSPNFGSISDEVSFHSSKGFSLSTNQYVSAAIDVSFSTEAYQFTGVSANRLRRNSTVLQQSSSQKLESRPAGST